MDRRPDRAVGCLVGSAVADALGGATEGWTPEQIRARYDGWVTGIVPPYYADWRNARPIAPYHKGDGHITDDTVMTHALVEVYVRADVHQMLDAGLSVVPPGRYAQAVASSRPGFEGAAIDDLAGRTVAARR